jgi:hypothetical protein
MAQARQAEAARANAMHRDAVFKSLPKSVQGDIDPVTGLPWKWVANIVGIAESGGRWDFTHGPNKASGAFQFMPGTELKVAQFLGLQTHNPDGTQIRMNERNPIEQEAMFRALWGSDVSIPGVKRGPSNWSASKYPGKGGNYPHMWGARLDRIAAAPPEMREQVYREILANDQHARLFDDGPQRASLPASAAAGAPVAAPGGDRTMTQQREGAPPFRQPAPVFTQQREARPFNRFAAPVFTQQREASPVSSGGPFYTEQRERSSLPTAPFATAAPFLRRRRPEDAPYDGVAERSRMAERYLGPGWQDRYQESYGDKVMSDEEIRQALETMGSYVGVDDARNLVDAAGKGEWDRVAKSALAMTWEIGTTVAFLTGVGALGKGAQFALLRAWPVSRNAGTRLAGNLSGVNDVRALANIAAGRAPSAAVAGAGKFGGARAAEEAVEVVARNSPSATTRLEIGERLPEGVREYAGDGWWSSLMENPEARQLAVDSLEARRNVFRANAEPLYGDDIVAGRIVDERRTVPTPAEAFERGLISRELAGVLQGIESLRNYPVEDLPRILSELPENVAIWMPGGAPRTAAPIENSPYVRDFMARGVGTVVRIGDSIVHFDPRFEMSARIFPYEAIAASIDASRRAIASSGRSEFSPHVYDFVWGSKGHTAADAGDGVVRIFTFSNKRPKSLDDETIWAPGTYEVYNNYVSNLRRRYLEDESSVRVVWEALNSRMPAADVEKAMAEVYENVIASDVVAQRVPDVLMAHENMHISQQALRQTADWESNRVPSGMSAPKNPRFYRAMSAIESSLNRLRMNPAFNVDQYAFNTAGSRAGDYGPYGNLPDEAVGTRTSRLSDYSAYQDVLSRNPENMSRNVGPKNRASWSFQEEIAELAGLLHGAGKDPVVLQNVLRQTRLRRAALRSYYDRLGVEAPPVLGRTSRPIARSMEEMQDKANRYRRDVNNIRRALKGIGVRLGVVSPPLNKLLG